MLFKSTLLGPEVVLPKFQTPNKPSNIPVPSFKECPPLPDFSGDPGLEPTKSKQTLISLLMLCNCLSFSNFIGCFSVLLYITVCSTDAVNSTSAYSVQFLSTADFLSAQNALEHEMRDYLCTTSAENIEVSV